MCERHTRLKLEDFFLKKKNMQLLTYDINDIHNIWWYGCPENRQDLSYWAPCFKVTPKVIFMPKNLKTKNEDSPLVKIVITH